MKQKVVWEALITDIDTVESYSSLFTNKTKAISWLRDRLHASDAVLRQLRKELKLKETAEVYDSETEQTYIIASRIVY